MNKVILLLIIFSLLFASCRSTKKATKSDAQTRIETKISNDIKVEDKVSEKKDLNVKTTIVVDEVEYAEPTVNQKDSTASNTEPTKGAVKKTKRTTTTTEIIDQGVVTSSHKEENKSKESNSESSEIKTEVISKATVPFPWWAITVMLGIIVFSLIYFKGPIGVLYKKIFTKIK